ncbi:hypothetical protein BC629DRAFT_1536365 [Irpex lacteus]|nr:hypothetical protein BC629DRAFT_1536365 [Irpex lacteus]
MDASTSSTHMPRSIFPDIPASRRAATITPNYADTGHSSPAPPPLNPADILHNSCPPDAKLVLSGTPAQSDSTPQPRRASSSSSHSHSQEDAPPVPQLPQWARGAVKRSHTHRQSHHPRRSTSPTMPTSDPLLPSQFPNTSRNPEENWMTSASAPRFSRLSLKADGVVMPVSVKEARRRSTASLSSRMSASDVRGLKGKQSTRSLRSRLAEDAEMQPPRPLFRGDSNASSSSLGSSITDTDSILTETRSISRMSSMTDGELPLPHGYAEEGKSTSTLELRINDVTIDMINYEHMEHVESPRSFTEMELATIAEVEAREVKGVTETGVETAVVDSPTPTKVKRRGTLKKVWKRVVRSVTG